jgi:prephenate dehydrogenase
MAWKQVTLIGVGLLGGSMGLALRRGRLAERVVGYVRRPSSIEECGRCGVVDLATCDLQEAVTGADLVVLCTPLARMRTLAERMAPALQANAIVTDVGSVKAPVVQELEPVVMAAGACFLGSHPMAGAERTGVSAARADLFDNAVCVITPTANSPSAAVGALEDFWRALGARPLQLSAELHDRLVSRSSHLPHVMAAELADYILDPVHAPEQRLLCANGFKDTTRIASGSPEMWRDIVLANRKNLDGAIETLLARLIEFRSLLERGDGESIQNFFEQAKQRRDQWCAQWASPSPE